MSEKSLPAVSYLKIPDDGDPYLEGHKCGNCGAVFLGERSVCSKCFSRDNMSADMLSLEKHFEQTDLSPRKTAPQFPHL